MERFLFNIENIRHSLLQPVDLKVETSPMSQVIFPGFYEKVCFFHRKILTLKQPGLWDTDPLPVQLKI